MKLDKGILWAEICANLQIILMTSSSFQFYDVIKVEGFRGVLLNISKTNQLIFTKQKKFTNLQVSFFGQLSIVPLEIKRLKTGHFLLLW